MLHVPAITSNHAQRPYYALSASVTYVRRKRLMYVESTRKKTDKAPIRGEVVPVSDHLIAATSGGFFDISIPQTVLVKTLLL